MQTDPKSHSQNDNVIETREFCAARTTKSQQTTFIRFQHRNQCESEIFELNSNKTDRKCKA